MSEFGPYFTHLACQGAGQGSMVGVTHRFQLGCAPDYSQPIKIGSRFQCHQNWLVWPISFSWVVVLTINQLWLGYICNCISFLVDITLVIHETQVGGNKWCVSETGWTQSNQTSEINCRQMKSRPCFVTQSWENPKSTKSINTKLQYNEIQYRNLTRHLKLIAGKWNPGLAEKARVRKIQKVPNPQDNKNTKT